MPRSFQIDGYGPGFFRVNDQVINGAALVLPARTIPWGGYGDTDSILTAVDDIDVVFIGTGAEITHLPVDFKETAGSGRDRGGTDVVPVRLQAL